MLFRSTIVAFFIALSSIAAFADGPPGAGAPPPGAPGAMPWAPKYMYKAGGLGTMGLFSDKPGIGFAYLPIDHAMVALAVGLKYDGNGLPIPMSPTGARMPSQWAWDLILSVEYMIHDSYPFAMGPQFAAIMNFYPGDSLANVILMPAWGFWYAPFNAPIGIGSALAVQIQLTKGMEPVVSLVTPGVRFVYVFN